MRYSIAIHIAGMDVFDSVKIVHEYKVQKFNFYSTYYQPMLISNIV